MTANYHTHTFRCGHAVGEDRAYVDTAIERGLKVLGFSDHVPMPFQDGHESRFRVPLRLLEDYVTSVLDLKREYKGQIDIRLGFEAEYYPDLFEPMMALLSPYPVEYLLLAQHFNDSAEAIYNPASQLSRQALSTYVDRVIEGMETGVFTYVAHPDLMNYVGSPAVFDRHYGRLIERAKALDIPLEINLLGIRDHRAYPHDRFFELCGQAGAPVCIGCDAHSADKAYDGPSYAVAMEMKEKFGLCVVDCPVLVPVHNL